MDFDDALARVRLLYGDEGLERLKGTHVAVFGLGGVGSWTAECLARSGMGRLTLVDDDTVAPSNINRQIEAEPSTIGLPKALVLAERLRKIAPWCETQPRSERFTAAATSAFPLDDCQYVIDAIDSVADKAALVLHALSQPGVTLFSSMGAAMRLRGDMVRECEFWHVEGDGLARALRQRFRRSGQLPPRPFSCVYSSEPPMPCLAGEGKGSLCHVTAVFGMRLAGLVMRDIYERL